MVKHDDSYQASLFNNDSFESDSLNTLIINDFYKKTQYPAHRHQDGKGIVISIPQGRLYYAPYYFDKLISDYYLDHMLACHHLDYRHYDWSTPTELDSTIFKNINWRQDHIRLFGKRHQVPRLTAWYGDTDCTYAYSGIKLKPHAWTKVLIDIRESLRSLCQRRFNSVLLNWYRDGADYVSWHADNETVLGTNPLIASVNFGASRRFLMRQIQNHNAKIEIPLHHGSVLVMAGAVQHHWQHSVPKQKQVKHSRVNLTYRTISNPL